MKRIPTQSISWTIAKNLAEITRGDAYRLQYDRQKQAIEHMLEYLTSIKIPPLANHPELNEGINEINELIYANNKIKDPVSLIFDLEHKNVDADAFIMAAIQQEISQMVIIMLNDFSERHQTEDMVSNDTIVDAFILGIIFNNSGMITYLVPHLGEHGINIQNTDGNTALHLAIFYSNDEMVEELLKIKGISVNEENNYGYTPLKAAISNNKVEIVKLLLPHLDLNNDYGYYEDCACGKPEMLELLSKYKPQSTISFESEQEVEYLGGGGEGEVNNSL